ncbi:glycoside hydrolase family 73 protein [Paenibacillus hodogayensis]|uniref:Glycoside hydrolase family 73 protein n=1 Tax=Paenibacillus hodogayensis TaxID=279208 RepID=A0ABV5VW66_9BACL
MDKATFITAIAPLAVDGQIRIGVLASITIAQAALESGWGMAAPGNNLFGIKGTGQDIVTGEYADGRFVTVKDGFRMYASWEESIIDHSRYLLANSRYRAAGFWERCAELDYRGAARALQTAGYATDPNYAGKLIALIEANYLARYDRVAAARTDEKKPAELEAWQWKMLGDSLEGLSREGFLTDSQWTRKAYSAAMTVSELEWLGAILFARDKGIDV